MIRLFIEDQELDVNDNFSHQITYAVDDLKNLDAKATSFSKTLIIPGTANNNKLFGNIFQFSNSNFPSSNKNVGYDFNASKSAKALLQSNGLTIIKGSLRLLQIVIDGESIEYEIAIFGELGGFISALGNNKLEDLDYSYWNHTYDTTNIKNSWTLNRSYSKSYAFGVNTGVTFGTNYVVIPYTIFPYLEVGDSIQITGSSGTGGPNNGTKVISSFVYDYINNVTTIYFTTSTTPLPFSAATLTLINKRGIGYYYPLIDYGNQSTNKKDYQYKTFRPAIFVYDYITKIIANAGYTYNSNFFKSDFFTRLIVPHNDKLLYNLNATSYGTVTKTTTQVTPINYVGYYYNVLLTFDSWSLTFFNVTSSGIFTATSKCTVDINFNISLNSFKNTGGDSFIIFTKVTPNGNEDTELQRIEGVGDYDFQYKINQSFEVGDSFRIYLKVFGSLPSFAKYTKLTVDSANLQIDKSPAGYIEYAINNTINVNYAIPKNILQKDFFTSILKMFNLMVTEDKLIEKRLNIEPWVDFYNLDRTTYQDWSYKIDRSNVIKIKPMSEINARYYNFKFKSDSDYFNDLYKKKYNQGYGDIVYDNQLEFAKESASTEVIFSATPLVGWTSEDKITPAIFKWDGVTKGTNEEAVSSNIRILQCMPVSGVTSWAIKDGGTTLSSQTNYGYAGHFDNPDAPNADLNFGATNELYFTLVAGGLQNNMFNAYYSSYMAEITDKDSRLVTAKIKLTEQDIYNLDFGKFIYVDGVLYRLQKIIDYSAGEICTVELLRVIYTQY